MIPLIKKHVIHFIRLKLHYMLWKSHVWKFWLKKSKYIYIYNIICINITVVIGIWSVQIILWCMVQCSFILLLLPIEHWPHIDPMAKSLPYLKIHTGIVCSRVITLSLLLLLNLMYFLSRSDSWKAGRATRIKRWWWQFWYYTKPAD